MICKQPYFICVWINHSLNCFIFWLHIIFFRYPRILEELSDGVSSWIPDLNNWYFRHIQKEEIWSKTDVPWAYEALVLLQANNKESMDRNNDTDEELTLYSTLKRDFHTSGLRPLGVRVSNTVKDSWIILHMRFAAFIIILMTISTTINDMQKMDNNR